MVVYICGKEGGGEEDNRMAILLFLIELTTILNMKINNSYWQTVGRNCDGLTRTICFLGNDQ